MELTLAILLVLGVFIGIPAAIGLAIAGYYYFGGRRQLRVNRAGTLAEAEALLERSLEFQEEFKDTKPEEEQAVCSSAN